MANNYTKIKAQLDLSYAEAQMSSFLKAYKSTPIKIKVDLEGANSDFSKQLQTQIQAIEKTANTSLQQINKLQTQLSSSKKGTNLTGPESNPYLSFLSTVGQQFKSSTAASVKNAGKPKSRFHYLRYS